MLMVTKLRYEIPLAIYENGVAIVKNKANYSYYVKKIVTFVKQFHTKNLKSQVLF